MNVNQHNVKTITYETRVFEGFSCIKMTITDTDGVKSEIELFAEELQNLTFVNKGIEIIGK